MTVPRRRIQSYLWSALSPSRQRRARALAECLFRARRRSGLIVSTLLLAMLLSFATTIGPALPYVAMNGMDDLRLVWNPPTNVVLNANQGTLRLLESRYVRPATATQVGAEYVLEKDFLLTRTYSVNWQSFTTPTGPLPRVVAPGWSVHHPSSRNVWHPGTFMMELACGWPVRSIAVSRASADLGYMSLPPLGVAATDMGFLSVTWHTRWWALLINIASCVPIVIAIRRGPWALRLLRRYLRRRRGVCVVCTYPVRGFTRCSECGTLVDARGATASASTDQADSQLPISLWASTRRLRFFFLAFAAVALGAGCAGASAFAGFAQLLHKHSELGWVIDDQTYSNDLESGLASGHVAPLLTKGSAPDGYKYFTAHHVFATTVRCAAWDKTHAIPARATPSRPQSWSVHQFDWTPYWPPETVVYEVAVGWPLRFVIARRGELRDSNPPVIVLHRGGSRSDYGRWGFMSYVQWQPLAVNIACWTAIVIGLSNTVKVAARLRSRRSGHRRDA